MILENSSEYFCWGPNPAHLTKQTKILTKMKGSTNTSRFKKFQIRWAEKLGYENDPYLVRWTFILFGYSMRIHHWIKSDDRRYFHDHSADLLSIVLKGKYDNVVPLVPGKAPSDIVEVVDEVDCNGLTYTHKQRNERRCHVEGIFNSWGHFFHMNKSIWFSKAEQQHYLDIPKGGAWTLMFESKPRIKWGFFVNEHKWRPLRYFNKFGIIQTSDYQ